eukprot:UN27940
MTPETCCPGRDGNWNEDWVDLDEVVQDIWGVLGVDEDSWDTFEYGSWMDLSNDEREAAAKLCFTQETWDADHGCCRSDPDTCDVFYVPSDSGGYSGKNCKVTWDEIRAANNLTSNSLCPTHLQTHCPFTCGLCPAMADCPYCASGVYREDVAYKGRCIASLESLGSEDCNSYGGSGLWGYWNATHCEISQITTSKLYCDSVKGHFELISCADQYRSEMIQLAQ